MLRSQSDPYDASRPRLSLGGDVSAVSPGSTGSDVRSLTRSPGPDQRPLALPPSPLPVHPPSPLHLDHMHSMRLERTSSATSDGMGHRPAMRMRRSASTRMDPSTQEWPVELNPIAPCGACNEWLRKIAEVNPEFKVRPRVGRLLHRGSRDA